MSAGAQDSLSRDTHEFQLFSGCARERLHCFQLCQRSRIRNIKSVTGYIRRIDCLETGANQVVHMDELHQAAPVTGQNHWPALSNAIPEKCFAVKRIPGAIDERRPERDYGETVALVHPE